MQGTSASQAATEPFPPRQTNIGLYVQMHLLGFSKADIIAVQVA